MQVTRPNKIWRPGVRLHPKACAALGLEAERATPKRLGTLVPRTCMHALGTRYAKKSGEPLGFRPKEGTCASMGAPFGQDKHVTPAAISPPGVAWGRFVRGQQSGLAGCKLPPLVTRGASSCSSQGRRQGKPWGASPRLSAPTYLPPLVVSCTGPRQHHPRTTFHEAPSGNAVKIYRTIPRQTGCQTQLTWVLECGDHQRSLLLKQHFYMDG